MTTSKNTRGVGENIARESTEGVTIDGFQDPTGEYPKREYNYGTSNNKAARGLKVNDFYIGGGDIGVSLNIEDQEPSRFPYNQVKETPSGHVVEYDDTPGGERILIKHRKGAGVELRADGSVIISAINNKIEVTGGDQTTIIEGNGNLVYKGNLNLQVTGDYNVDVGGNYNVNVQGHHTEEVLLNHRTTVGGDRESTVKQSRSSKVLESNVDAVFGNNDVYVKGHHKHRTEGEMNVFSQGRYITTSAEAYSISSPVMNIDGAKLSVVGMEGMIGGEKIEFTGSTYMGKDGATPFASGAAFYGSFHGQATEAIRSYGANHANYTNYAANAGKAQTAVTDGGPAPSTKSNPSDYAEAVEGQEEFANVKDVPVVGLVQGIMTSGDYAVRTVSIDPSDDYKNSILLRDDYEGLFEKIPTTQELRSTMRDQANMAILINKMVSEGRISPTYTNTSPPKIGRTSPKEPQYRFGYSPLGNGIANRGKRFK